MPTTLDVSFAHARLRDWGRRAVQKVDHVYRESAFEVTRNVVAGGPYAVGTPVKTGAARDSWTMVRPGESPPEFVRGGPIRDQSGEAVLRQALSVLNSLGHFETVILSTSCPYMPRLETGWSQQAPSGMVRTTVRNWEDIVRDAYRRVEAGQTFTAAPDARDYLRPTP